MTRAATLLAGVVALVVTTAAPAVAAAKTVRLAYGTSQTLEGVTVKIEVRNHAPREDGGVDGEYALVVSKGGKEVEDLVVGESPWFELVAFDRLIWVRGDINDFELTVVKAGKLGKTPLADDDGMALVAAEAARRGITHDYRGASHQGGLIDVVLRDGGRDVVRARLGQRSKKFLRFDVDPYARIAMPPARGAKAIELAYDAKPTKLGGLLVALEVTNHKQYADRQGSVGEYTLTVSKGNKVVMVESGWVDTPAFELIAFGKLIQVVGGDSGALVTVAPAGKAARRKPLDDEGVLAVVEAEAKRRGISHDGSGSSGGSGVMFVALAVGGDNVVQAVVGVQSRQLIRFDVTAPPP